jgi:DNA repair protein RadC
MKKMFTVRDMPLQERPRERMQKYGIEALSPAEILALILGRGTAGEPVMKTAESLIIQFGGLKGLEEASVENLMKVDGIGLAKAAQIKGAFELARRADLQAAHERLGIKAPACNPKDAAELIRNEVKGKKKEHFYALLLDARNRLIRAVEVSSGSLDSSFAHPRQVFKEAIAASASAIIVAHNHPSGDCTPSTDDIDVTKRLVETGKTIDIQVLDHIIVSDSAFVSMKARGMI